MCPSRAGWGIFSHSMSVSLVPRLTATSPSSKRMPARDAGLSPVKATTLQSAEKPYCSTRYWETDPSWLQDGAKVPSFSLSPGAHACEGKSEKVVVKNRCGLFQVWFEASQIMGPCWTGQFLLLHSPFGHTPLLFVSTAPVKHVDTHAIIQVKVILAVMK